VADLTAKLVALGQVVGMIDVREGDRQPRKRAPLSSAPPPDSTAPPVQARFVTARSLSE
jgi:hypothetical protein